MRKYFKENIAVIIFAFISVIVVLIQTNRLWILLDLSYIIEHSFRMSMGEVIYKEFFVPYPPGTFIIQEILIIIFGRTLYPQIIYCCIISFWTYIITFNILSLINKDKVLNLFLALPVSITGGYGIWNQPFYDPDYVFFMLLSVFLLLYIYSKNFPLPITILSGAVSVMPSFFKQNTGLIYITAVNMVLIACLIVKKEKIEFKHYIFFLLGSLLMSILFTLYINITSGLNNFIYNVFTIPAQMRLPQPLQFIFMFINSIALRGLFALLLIPVVIRYLKISNKWKVIVTSLLALLPFFILPLFRLVILNRQFVIQYMSIWPVILLACFISIIYSFLKRNDIEFYMKLFPAILIVTTASAFLSQGYWGSTYALWPMLMVIFGFIFLFIARSENYNIYRYTLIFTSLALTITMLILVSIFYQQTYAGSFDNSGNTKYSSAIKGLVLPGDYLTNFDELILFTEKEIPKDESILILPHEDPFYFATGRKPLFTFFMFDWIFKINSVEDLIEKVKDFNVKWIILKTKLQALGMDGFTNFELFTLKVKREFKLYKTLPGYEIYKNIDSVKNYEP